MGVRQWAATDSTHFTTMSISSPWAATAETASFLTTAPQSIPPLVEAARDGNLAIVKLLVEKGADVNRKSASAGNRTALDQAERHGNDDVAAYLRSKGAVSSKKTSH